MKDWTGNGNSIYKTLGASSHTTDMREENDYYATEPKAIKLLLEMEEFNEWVWEPACGEGHISKVLQEKHFVVSTDLINRGFGTQQNFLEVVEKWDGDIITNPPYKYATEFIQKALEIIPEGNKVAMFLKVQFLEGKARKKLFSIYPPRTVYVASSRLMCAKNGLFEEALKGGGSAVAYAWFVWHKGFKGDTIIKWFN